jgi:hypothetical protein
MLACTVVVASVLAPPQRALAARGIPGAPLALAPEETTGDDRDEATPRMERSGGMPVVRVDADLQRDSGIEVSVLEAESRPLETTAYAEVVDLQPLLEQRAEHNRLVAERRADAATLAASRQDYDRLRALREQKRYVSEQELVAAQARAEGDEARLQGIESQLKDLRALVLQSWGTRLTGWALDGGSDEFERLVAREDVLLLVSLRAGDTLPEGEELILVGRDQDPAQYARAELVSSAPRTDPAFQGETWYFRADAGRLRTGMRVDALIRAGAGATTGVRVPASAIVWEGGKPWVYLQLDEVRFARRALESWRETGATWFVSGALAPGQRVVRSGAQMLLSEELRSQIPEERND